METIMRLPDCIQWGVFAVLALFACPGHAQDEITITAQRLNDTVSVLFGEGGNIGVSAGSDGIFIIDNQYVDSSDAIRETIATISDQPIRYVLNTHWHFDHAGSNESFGNTGSTIIAHDNVRKRMASGGYIGAVDRDIPPAPAVALPVITFDDSMTLHLNGEAVYLFHVSSSHTDGDGIIWFKDSNIIHMGDTFLNGIYPLADLDSGGSINGIITAADTVLSFIDDQTQIIPGHGPVASKAVLKEYRDMCVVLRDRIADMKENGMSLEDVIAAAPTSDYDSKWDSWGEGWRTVSITALYEEAP
jgi:glyoxylase-like metal-dependent hydrolase (beta-lactamase superfamily II)